MDNAAKIERVSIYIDGGNFHHLVLKKLGTNELGFSFDAFAKFLAGDRTIVEAGRRYYVGTIRERVGDERSKHAMSNQTKFFSVMKSGQWELKTSKLRTRTERIVIDERVVGYKDLLAKGVHEIEFERMREKGIDVKLATDVVVAAVDDKYDTAIVVSSDTDLTPALDWVRKRKKKRIEYVGFSIPDQDPNTRGTRPSQALITYSDVQRTLIASDLKPFILAAEQERLLR